MPISAVGVITLAHEEKAIVIIRATTVDIEDEGKEAIYVKMMCNNKVAVPWNGAVPQKCSTMKWCSSCKNGAAPARMVQLLQEWCSSCKNGAVPWNSANGSITWIRKSLSEDLVLKKDA